MLVAIPGMNGMCETTGKIPSKCGSAVASAGKTVVDNDGKDQLKKKIEDTAKNLSAS